MVGQMRKPTKTALKRKADKLFSEKVRSLGYCLWCNRRPPVVQLQCAHIMSRRFLSTRWDFNNAMCLCAGCHRKGHDRPLEFAELVRQVKGQEAYDELIYKAKNVTRQMKLYDYQDLVKELRDL